jgi:hypothetical protein
MREMSVTEQRYKAVLAVIGDGRTVSEVATDGACLANDIDSGVEIDHQFGNMLGVSPGLTEHGETCVHGLLCLCL